MKRALLIFAIAGVMSAQTTAPKIPDALQAKFWKAQASVTQAEAKEQFDREQTAKAQSEYSSVVKEIQDLCGSDFIPQMNKDGNPVCVAKPAAKPDAKTEQKKP